MSGIRSSLAADVSALKDIPGYKAILKTVLKSQIQLLIEQLAENTGEESIILTASINDGSLSHLGSNMGKSFLDGREEIKSQFLGFCLKGHHQSKQEEETTMSFRHSNQMYMSQMPPRRPRIRAHPYAVSPPQSHSTPSNRRHSSQDLDNSNNTSSTFIKPEDTSSNSVDNFLESVATNNQQENNLPITFPSSVNLSHTQTSAHTEDKDENQPGLSGDNEDKSTLRIKLEPGLDEVGEDGTLESADNSAASDNWFQNSNDTDQPGFNSKDMSITVHYSSQVVSQDGVSHKIYTCSYCGKQSFRKGDIDRHVVKHTKVKRFMCPECDQGYTRKQGLIVHLARMHPDYSAADMSSPINYSQWGND